MSVEKNVPEIRFTGFSGKWTEKELNKEVELFSGLTYSPKDVRKEGVFVIRSSNVKNGQLVNADNVYVNPEVVNCSNVKKGDIIVVVRNGSRSLIGKHAQVNSCMAQTVIGAFMTGVRGKQPEFINALFDTNQFTAQVEKNLGATINQITNGAFNSMVFMFPEELEQTSIGNTFQKLDSLINQHQQKHDKLCNIKKAMLEKMFPKQGEIVPEIRFKGFSGEWEDIGLLESIERIIDFRGRTPKKLGLDWSPSGYRALSALNVKQGYIDFSIDPHFGDQELYDKWMSGSELHQGQVLFTTEAPMGNVAQVPNADKYILSQRTIAFVVKPKVITDAFLAVLLRSSKVFRELSALSSGGTAKGVSQKALANLNVLIPSDLDEQTAIGNYFQNLDTLINQHQQQITKLTNIKQACLSKMFV
ncbi:restriction endonuclease subunit S (plasmid) [Vibrio alginolyticus]